MRKATLFATTALAAASLFAGSILIAQSQPLPAPPPIMAPVLVAWTLKVATAVLLESYISYLGYGVQPPNASWGNMLNNAVEYIKSTPSLAFWPGLFILFTVACFNFLGDGMRDALDPHQVMKRAKGI